MIEIKKIKNPLSKKILILYNLNFYLNLNVIKKIHYCIFIKIYFYFKLSLYYFFFLFDLINHKFIYIKQIIIILLKSICKR